MENFIIFMSLLYVINFMSWHKVYIYTIVK